MKTPTTPKTLVEAINYFADSDRALAFLISLRWPENVTCPTCGSTDVRFLASRRIWKCKTKHSRQQFSIKVGTIFEDSPIGLEKWLPAMWMMVNCKNGVSSYEVHRALGVTQKTAWFMLHRLRLATQTGTFEKLSGHVEVDETYIGGLSRNMHADKRKKKIKGTGGSGKSIVIGMLERQGRIAAKAIRNTKRETLHQEIKDHVNPGSTVYTDDWRGYRKLPKDYEHQVINHAQSYVRGQVHTNTIENFWSLLKRTIKGTYVSVEPFHLFRYLDEQVFRFNTRKGNDASRFHEAIQEIIGKRLTYAHLLGLDRPTCTT